MKITFFWVVVLFSSKPVSRPLLMVSCLDYSSTLQMDVMCYSEMLDLLQTTVITTLTTMLFLIIQSTAHIFTDSFAMDHGLIQEM
jgi:hypothetical protein